tara:strand:+ start:2394 stop:4208 length:1815 start_codon:yes stop_codon:yes gene_type:complete
MPIKQFPVTDLDFGDIKSAIKDYYKRSEGPFKDFDFEGSGLSLILDILAHNTHYNAVLAHLAANETFISSAQMRKNVVARAKALGYTPHGVGAPSATVTLVGLPSSIVSLPEGTTFTSTDTLNNTTYTFSTIEEIANPTGEFAIYQGSYQTQTYAFDDKVKNLKFEIPNKNVDITKIQVVVRDSATSTKKEIYTQFSELPGITGTSAIYFINENPNGFYEIAFGDNVLGKKPAPASQVEIKYFTTKGTEGNGLSTFSVSDSIFNGAIVNVVASNSSSGGGVKEGIESIRQNAPLQLLSQNRAVTVDDYVALVRKNANVKDVAIWGGEDNDPPEYGRVFVSGIPTTGETLSQDEKDRLTAILNGKGILTVRPKFTDPVYTYLYFDIFTHYNSALTNLSAAGISAKVRDALTAFNTSYLSDFEGVFRYSEFLRYIVDLDNAILSAYARVYAYKKFTATTANTSKHVIEFNFALEEPDDPTESLITSTSYVSGSDTFYFKDEPSSVANIRNIYRYTVNADGVETTHKRNCGTVNFSTGKIEIDYFDITADTEIKIFARPNSNTLVPVRNQVIEIDASADTIITSSIDTVATKGTAGSLEYFTPARER